MTNSILDSTKKILGMDSSYTAFDLDIITHINTVFTTLHDLGVGPVEGFMISDKDANWEDFTDGASLLNAVKSYMFLRVKLLFDPPQNAPSYMNSLEKQVQELEWRISTRRENEEWVAPVLPSSPSLP